MEQKGLKNNKMSSSPERSALYHGRRRRYCQPSSRNVKQWKEHSLLLLILSTLALFALSSMPTTNARFPRWDIQGPLVTILVKDKSSDMDQSENNEVDLSDDDDDDEDNSILKNQASLLDMASLSPSSTTDESTAEPPLIRSSSSGTTNAKSSVDTSNPKIPLARRILSLPQKVVSQQARPRAWMNQLSSVRPKAVWRAQTREPPLPVWLPALKQVGASWCYEYHKLKTRPSWVEWTAKFSRDFGDLWVQPSWDFWEQEKNRQKGQHVGNKKWRKSAPTSHRSPFHFQLQFARGSSFLKARLAPFQNGSSKTTTKRGNSSFLESLSGSFTFDLPYSALRTVRLTPHLDFMANSDTYDFTCNVEALTGGAGRTKAVLHLEYDNPTLAVVHQLDERNTVSPEIHIYNARIKYQWDYHLGGSSMLRTQIDPHDSIAITWTDESARDGGTWVTDVRLPLTGSIPSLAADVRIQRQFRF